MDSTHANDATENNEAYRFDYGNIYFEGTDGVRVPWKDISENPKLARMKATGFYDSLSEQLLGQLQKTQRDTLGSGDLPITVHLHGESFSKAEKKPPLIHPNGNYRYPKLSSGVRFRTIILLADKNASSDIRCRLADMSLDNPPKYEAISYVWGPQDTLVPISLDGRPFLVSDRLLEMLRTFREPNRNRMLWVDAICINQASVEDRNEQVSRMDLIYSRAARVTIWFGQASKRTEFAFSCMELFADIFMDRHPFTAKTDKFFDSVPGAKFCYAIAAGLGNIWRATHRSSGRMGTRSYDLQQLADEPKWLQPIQLLTAALTHKKSALLFDELQFIAENDWWHRVWVLQEATLGRNVNVQLGGFTISWNILREILLCVAQLCVGNNRDLLFHQMQLRKSLQFSLHITSQLVSFALPFFLFADPQFQPNLETLLMMSGPLNATDSRDRAFSLYGLVDKTSEEREFIRPDYGSSYQVIMTRLAQSLFQRDKTLDVLGAKNDWYPDLPSWVPSWNFNSGSIGKSNTPSVALGNCSTYGARRPGADCLYNASLYKKCPSPYAFDFPQSTEIFNIRGYRVSQTSATIEALDMVFGNSYGDVKVRYKDTPGVEEMFNYDQPDTENGRDHWLDGEDQPTIVHPNNNQEEQTLDSIQASLVKSQVDIWSRWLDFGDARSSDPYPISSSTSVSSSVDGSYTKSEAFYRTVLLDRQWQRPNTSSSFAPTSAIMTTNLVRLPSKFSTIEIPFMERWPPEDHDDEQTFLYYLLKSQSSHFVWEGFSAHSLGQKLMKTKDGQIGIVPESAKVGDWIVVAFGGSVPLILRKIGARWVFVGLCYVHGIMDGEIVTQMNDLGEEPELFSII